MQDASAKVVERIVEAAEERCETTVTLATSFAFFIPFIA